MPEVRLVNRTQKKAEEIAAFLADDRMRIVPWEGRHDAVAGCGLIANTTSLGMLDGPPLDLSLSSAPDDCIVYDIVYKPLETPLLAAAARRDLLTVDGLGMLMHQAVPGFRKWFGGEAVVEEDLKTVVRKAAGC